MRLLLYFFLALCSTAIAICSEKEKTVSLPVPPEIAPLLQDVKIFNVKKLSETRYDCRDVFESLGAVFSHPEVTCIFETDTGLLQIHADEENIEMIKAILPTLPAEHALRSDAMRYEWISLYALISDPQKYDQKEVLTAGYLLKTHRGSFLFLHKDDAEHLLFENAIGIDMSKLPSEEIVSGYVRLKGMFHSYPTPSKVALRGYLKTEATNLMPVERK